MQHRNIGGFSYFNVLMVAKPFSTGSGVPVWSGDTSLGAMNLATVEFLSRPRLDLCQARMLLY